MVFSSIPFLYYFLPAVILSYFAVSWAVEKAVPQGWNFYKKPHFVGVLSGILRLGRAKVCIFDDRYDPDVLGLRSCHGQGQKQGLAQGLADHFRGHQLGPFGDF